MPILQLIARVGVMLAGFSLMGVGIYGIYKDNSGWSIFKNFCIILVGFVLTCLSIN